MPSTTSRSVPMPSIRAVIQAGRPKAVKTVIEAARERTADAITTLTEICVDATAPSAARISAAQVLLDRSLGAPDATKSDRCFR